MRRQGDGGSSDGDTEKSPLFTRSEVLGGTISGRRAQALLFLIEYWSARLAWQARRHTAEVAAATDLSIYAPILLEDAFFEETSDGLHMDPNDSFYRAFGLSREGLPPATAIQIEEHAPEWGHLVPDNARLRAQVANLLFQKYKFVERTSAHLRGALGLDTETVQKAYQQLYRKPLADGWAAPPPTLANRLRGLFGGGSNR